MLTHFLARSAGDFLRTLGLPGGPRMADEVHLGAAIAWLMRSIEACDGRGSSKGYRFLKGWMPAYPETSGYIIPTLLMLARENAEDAGEYRRRASAIAEWLASIQLPSGGFCGRELGVQAEPDVFDTGMILLGFNALRREGVGVAVEAPARRAAEFLLSSLDEAGCFVRHNSHDMLHAYNVRAAWGLVAYGKLTNERRFVEAGVANARWTCGQQNEAGYFDCNAFKPRGNANVHGTAYVLDGLLRIDALVPDQIFFDSVVRAARALQRRYAATGWIAAELGPAWQYLSHHVCLTGLAQLAIVFLMLSRRTGEQGFRATAELLIDDVARRQDLRDRSAPWYGAVAGSFPIYGRYAPLQYPNWATKFFIDALLTKRQVDRGQASLEPFQFFGG